MNYFVKKIINSIIISYCLLLYGCEKGTLNKKNDFNNEVLKAVPFKNNSQKKNIGIFFYGQSLAVRGSGDFNESELAGLKQFKGGAYINYNRKNNNSRYLFYGNDFVPMDDSGKETPAKAACLVVKKLLKSENNINIENKGLSFIGASAGVPGAHIAELSNVYGNYYLRLIEALTKAKEFSIKHGENFGLGALCWMQGENTGDRYISTEAYYTKLKQLFDRINKDAKRITGQTKDVQFFVYQIASHNNGTIFKEGVPLAFNKIARDLPNVHFATAMYQYKYVDPIHVSDVENTKVGATFGAAIKKVLFDNKEYRHLSIEKKFIYRSSGKWILELKMNIPVPPLKIDVNTVTPQLNYGFSIKNHKNREIIKSVSIKYGINILLECSENPQNLELTYAIKGYKYGGNIKDNLEKTFYYTKDKNKYRVNNWLPILRENIDATEINITKPDSYRLTVDRFLKSRKDSWNSAQRVSLYNYVKKLNEKGIWNKLSHIFIPTTNLKSAWVNLKDGTTNSFTSGGEFYTNKGVNFKSVKAMPTIDIRNFEPNNFFIAANNTNSNKKENQYAVALAHKSDFYMILGRKVVYSKNYPSFLFNTSRLVASKKAGESIGLMTGNRNKKNNRMLINNEIFENKTNPSAYAKRTIKLTVGNFNTINEPSENTYNFFAIGKSLSNNQQDDFKILTQKFLHVF